MKTWETFLAVLGIIWDGSEGDLFFCSGGRCDYGNTMLPILNKMIRGVASEECCPYVDHDVACGEGRCVEWYKTAKKIKKKTRLHSAEEMKEALKKGPIIGTMAVHQSFLHVVSNDVYHSLGPADPIVGYHCIEIVGCSDNLGAWRIGNSWGEDWGAGLFKYKGFCWLRYEDSEIEEESYEIELSDEAVEEDPEPEESWWERLIRLIIEFLEDFFFVRT